MAPPQIIWFRQDLRLVDQRAVTAAARAGPVVPVYILDESADRKMGGASRWWLHHSLRALDADLRRCGARLLLLRGDAVPILQTLVERMQASAIHALDHYDPTARRQQAALEGILHLYPGTTLAPPGHLVTATGTPFKVFTPFWRALGARMPPPAPSPAPDRLTLPDALPEGDKLDDWALQPHSPNWAVDFPRHWQPGTAGAMNKINAFCDHAGIYKAERDLLAQEGTSRLSPHLHFGEISPAQLWHAVPEAEAYLRQLGWRDFSINLLYQSPELATRNWRSAFDHFPWITEDGLRRAWQQGRTGYPVVDAAMRQLWQTGWMHNRARMIAASFLTKHLLIDWRVGERWFWDTLVDADEANNAAGWQWTAGSGADAAPYFRIFNPITQGQKFDPEGSYVRQYVPELAALPNAYIHAPWTAPPLLLTEAGVKLGVNYPWPIVDHASARMRALAAYDQIKTRL